jgi:prepilin-type processing-associated H-X9-DG protein
MQAAACVLITVICSSLSLMACGSPQDTTCSDNLRRIWSATSLYAEANDGRFPPAYDIAGLKFNSWHTLVAPYMKGAGNVHPFTTGNSWPGHVVPATPTPDVPSVDKVWRCPHDTSPLGSYGVNPVVSGAVGYAYTRQSARTSDVEQPGTVFWAADTNHFWDAKKGKAGPVFADWVREVDLGFRGKDEVAYVRWMDRFLTEDYTDPRKECPYPTAGTGCRGPAYRHAGKANVLFCDGHVSAVPVGGLSSANVFPIPPKKAPPAPAPEYEAIDLGHLGVGTCMHAGGLNNAGVVVGGSDRGAANKAAVFRWKEGKMTVVGTLPGGGWSVGYGVNEKGDIVGSGDAEERSAFTVVGGKFRVLPPLPGYKYSFGKSIDDRGTVVGRSFGPKTGPPSKDDWGSRATLWRDGKAVELPMPPGYIASRAATVNDGGLIAGTLQSADHRQRACYWKDGKVHLLPYLPGGGEVGAAEAVNASGAFTGTSDSASSLSEAASPSSNPVHYGTVWTDGKPRMLPLLKGVDYMKGTAINRHGTVVGWCKSNQMPMPPFVWDEKRGSRFLAELIDDQSWFLMEAYAINDRGEILCWGAHGNKPYRLCLLRPKGRTSESIAAASSVAASDPSRKRR